MNDFAPHRPAGPHAAPQRAAQPAHPAPASTTPRTTAPAHSPLRPMHASSSQPTAAEPAMPRLNDDQPHESHAPKEPHETAHSGLVGLIVFIVLTALLFSPLLPGKILDNFPGSSPSFSTGDQTLACIDPLKDVASSQKYDSKLGAPVVYKYATTTTQTGTCDGKTQTAVAGHTSQFNPLGALMDLALAFVIAIVIAKLWRKLFARHR